MGNAWSMVNVGLCLSTLEWLNIGSRRVASKAKRFADKREA